MRIVSGPFLWIGSSSHRRNVESKGSQLDRLGPGVETIPGVRFTFDANIVVEM
jgi:hypothetical protein